MKCNQLLVVINLMLICQFSLAQSTFDGLWTGKILAGGIEVQMDFEINEENQVMLLSVPLQDLSDVKSTSFEISGDTLDAIFTVFNARYNAIYNEKTKAFEGAWTQGQTLTLDIKRTSQKTRYNRPQTPKAPFPYLEEELTIMNTDAGVSLSATMTIPDGDGPFPVAILVSGSGAQDRNSKLLGHEPFLVLADHLSRKGIAVIRYDDRGVGKSKGNHMASTTKDFAGDTKSIVEYARTLAKVDKSKIGIIGHSEGGMIASMVASEDKSVGFVVSLAGPAVPISEVMTTQNVMVLEKNGMTQNGLDITKENLPKIYSIVNQDKEPKELFDTLIKTVHGYYDLLAEEDQQKLAPTKASYYVQLAQSFFNPWFRYFLAYDPTESWQQVTCPVLALNGSEDVQVEAESNVGALKHNLAIAGNKNVNLEILKGLNHLFQPCETCNIVEYLTIETTMDPEVLHKIETFILSLD